MECLQGSELKVNEKTFAAVALLPRYFLAVAAFLKKTFLKILILSRKTAEGVCLPDKWQLFKIH